MDHISLPSFIYYSSVEHLGCFPLLAILNNAAVNIGVQIYEFIFNTTGYLLVSETAESYGNSV